jgi:hypothetical protein
LGVSADDTFLVLRGLPTMKLRFEAHDHSAREIATWLKSRLEITHILHPAFDDCPGHATWKRDFTGAGGLFSMLFDVFCMFFKSFGMFFTFFLYVKIKSPTKYSLRQKNMQKINSDRYFFSFRPLTFTQNNRFRQLKFEV